jgi:hypothetical protein
LLCPQTKGTCESIFEFIIKAKIYNQLQTTPWFKEMQKRQSAHLTILTQPAIQDKGNYLLNVGCNAPDRFITYRRFGVQRGSWALEEYK